MRRTPYLLLVATLLLAALNLISCGRDEEPDDPKREEEKEVNDWENEDINGDATMSPRMRFSLSDTIQVEGYITTRATYTKVDDVEKCLLDKDDVVTIEVSAGTGSARSTAKKNYLVGSDHTSLTYYGGSPSLNEFHWDYGTEKINIRAWSYGGTVADNATPITDPVGQEFSIETNQKTNGYKELLYSPQQTDLYFPTSKSGISLPLYHQLARVVVNLTHDKSGSLSVSHLYIGNSNIAKKAKFTPSNEKKWTDVSTYTETIEAKTETANSCYSAVLIPTSYNSGIEFIRIVSEGNTYVYTLPANVEFLAGKQYNYSITVKDGYIIVTNSITQWGGSSTPESTISETAVPGDPGVPIDNISYTHFGYFIASNNKLYATRSDAIACTGNEPFAVVAVVGKNDNYWDSFLALACEDSQNFKKGWAWTSTDSEAYQWAQNHPITIGGITYDVINPLTNYDEVENNEGAISRTRTTGATKGWRVPSVTDWRFVFNAFYSEYSTAGGIVANNYKSGEGTALANAINNATGVSLLAGHYWTSSLYSSGCPWFYHFNTEVNSGYWGIGNMSANPRIRLVFAY